MVSATKRKIGVRSKVKKQYIRQQQPELYGKDEKVCRLNNAGDLNVRIGNNLIPGKKNRLNEFTLNQNGKASVWKVN